MMNYNNLCRKRFPAKTRGSLQIKSQAPRGGKRRKISRNEMRRPVKFLSANVTIGLFRLQEIMFAERAEWNDKGRFGDKHDGSRDEARKIRRGCGKTRSSLGDLRRPRQIFSRLRREGLECLRRMFPSCLELRLHRGAADS